VPEIDRSFSLFTVARTRPPRAAVVSSVQKPEVAGTPFNSNKEAAAPAGARQETTGTVSMGEPLGLSRKGSGSSQQAA